MLNPQNPNPVPHIPKASRYALRLMSAIAVFACLFVLMQSCSVNKKPALMQFAKGELKKLKVLKTPPAQPQMIFETIDGDEVQLKDFRGKTLLVNAWATWCGPCINEMPSLNTLQEQRGSDKFAVITINMDRKIGTAQAFLDKGKYTQLPLYHDPSLSFNIKIGTQGIPISIFYTPEGQEIARIFGEVNWQGKNVSAFLDEIITNY